MPGDGTILTPSRVSRGSIERSVGSTSSRSRRPDAGGLFTWLASGGPSLQLAAVATGGVLAAVVPAGPLQRICTILLPSLFVLAARPEVRRALLGRSRRLLLRSRYRQSTKKSAGGGRRPEQSLSSRRLEGFSAAGSEAAFLRTFDRLEEIMQEALTLEVGAISEEFNLRDKVTHLEATGFLTPADLKEWSAALLVRHELLLAGEGPPGPSSQIVLGALSVMWKLQTRLIDRRRDLFEAEQILRQREDAVLRHAGIR